MTPKYLGSMLDQLWTLYAAEQTENHYIKQFDRAAFMAAAQPAYDQFAPDFASTDWNAEHHMPQAKFAVASFLYALKKPMTAFPMGLQRAFRDAFDRGEIDAIALGTAVRLIYRYHTPRRRSRGEAIPETLANLNLSDPAGIMIPSELAVWRALPDQVTIYRGALTYTPQEAVRGISWSLSRAHAAAHVYNRTLPVNEGTEIRRLLGQNPPPPQLIAAVAPKSAILAFTGSQTSGIDREVFVNYEQLDPPHIKSLPANNLLMQAVSERLVNIGRFAALAQVGGAG
ncbi:hypothetical protein [Sphingopyxis sp. MSC1_008]|jgi:hypothetical protein|uniref:hypothetical protein n=1 Tax=Sphingopyxis sp. MSC1_008 TaxID=2909265 RepID=UPI0020BDE5FF|nr:hypothetical protein [Sphingopyxis sp. MSC1_008]